MNDPFFLVLGSGRHQVPLLRTLREKGAKTVIADNNPDSPGRPLATVETLVDALDVKGCVKLAEKYGVDGVIACGTDQPVTTMAAVSEQLGKRCYLDVHSAILATDKAVQRKAFAEAQVPQPGFALCGDDLMDAHAAGLKFPVVVKPTDSQGQRGIQRVDGSHALTAAIQEALTWSRKRSVIVEEFEPGPEVTANVWIREGQIEHCVILDRIAYTDENCMGVCFQHIFPSAIDSTMHEMIRDAVERIILALQVKDGPLYVQLIAGKNGPKIVEAACRTGGGHEADLLPAVSAYSPIDELVGWYLREEPPEILRGESLHQAGLVNFIFSHAGTVRSFSPAQFDRSGEFYVSPNTEVTGMLDGQGRVGYFLVAGDDRDQITKSAREIYGSLELLNDEGANLVFYPDPSGFHDAGF